MIGHLRKSPQLTRPLVRMFSKGSELDWGFDIEELDQHISGNTFNYTANFS